MKRFLHFLTEAKQISAQKFENFVNSKKEELYTRFINDYSANIGITNLHPDDYLKTVSEFNFAFSNKNRDEETQNKLDAVQAEEHTQLKEKFAKNPNFHLDNATKYMKDLVNQADPTPNKEYGSWLVSNYLKKLGANENSPLRDHLYHIQRVEDIQEFREPLEVFHKNKQRKGFLQKLGYSNDIHSYTPDEFLNMHEDTKGKEPNPFPRTGFTTIHSDENLDIHKIENKAGACYWGHGTRWCTRHEPKIGGYFKDEHDLKNDPYVHYTGDPSHLPKHLETEFKKAFRESSEIFSPLFIVHNKKSGEKFQYHMTTSQFADKNDMSEGLHKQVPFEIFGKIIDSVPSLQNKDKDKALEKHRYIEHQVEYEAVNFDIDDVDQKDIIQARRQQLMNKHLSDDDVAHMFRYSLKYNSPENLKPSYNGILKWYKPKTNHPELMKLRKAVGIEK